MENRNIFKSTIIITFITLGVKILGLIKQSVIASYCGANEETDAFFIATGIIVQLATVIFSSISISFLSIHTDVLHKNGRQESNKLVNRVLRVFVPVSILIASIFFFFAPIFSKCFAPTYTKSQITILSRYIQIMSFSFILWCYYLIINVVIETEKIFFPGRTLGFFQNVFLIIAAIAFYERFGIVSLVYAFLLAGMTQCILVTVVARKNLCICFGKVGYWKECRELMLLSVPLIMGNAIYEINDIVDKQISTGLGAGYVSVLTYGGTINEIVTGVIVSSVSTVIFAHYATWITNGENDKVSINLRQCIEILIMLIFPVMAMCMTSGDQIVEILYGRGSFGKKEITSTYAVVIGYALGFVFQAVRANVVKVFYAFKDTTRPMINGAVSVCVNIALSFVLSKIIGISGVAVATSISMLIVSVLLLIQVKKYLPDFSLCGIIPEIYKGFGACILSAFCVLVLKKCVHFNIYVSFIIEGIACVCVYYYALKVMRSNFTDKVSTFLRSTLG